MPEGRVPRAELEDMPHLDRGLETKRAAAEGHASPSTGCLMSAKRRESRRARRRVDATRCDSRRRRTDLPAAHRPRRSHPGSRRASEPGSAPNAARISSSEAGSNPPPRAAASFASSSLSSPRTSPRTTVPSSLVTGIALDVAAGSIPRNPASSSIVAIPGVATSAGLSRCSGCRHPGHALRDLRDRR